VFLAENGPFQLNKDGGVEEREHAWDVTSNVIFVDSPIGTGFSYSDDPRDRVLNETTLAADMLDFLEEFFEGAPLLPACPPAEGFTT
jgi:carboxypeptidase C (cathepsin A)